MSVNLGAGVAAAHTRTMKHNEQIPEDLQFRAELLKERIYATLALLAAC